MIRLLLLLTAGLAGFGSAQGAPTSLPGYCAQSQLADAAPVVEVGGMADLARSSQYRLETTQPVGSVSKTLIGLSIAQLVERGELELEAPVDALLGWPVRNPRHPDQPVTLRQLATHTSGIVDREQDYQRAYVPEDADAPSLEQFLRDYLAPANPVLLRKRFSKAAPGQRYHYSNIGAALAALVVEKCSGQAFADYVHTHILAPLQMRRSGYPGFGEGDHAATAATLYEDGRVLDRYRLVTYPDGGLRSSCQDLGRYAKAVLEASAGERSALSTTAVRLMLTPLWSSPPSGAPASLRNHGLFWEFKDSGSIGHSGSDPGVTALLAIEPARHRWRVQLANTGIDVSADAAHAFMQVWRSLDTAVSKPEPGTGDMNDRL